MFTEEIKSYLENLKDTCPNITNEAIQYYQQAIYAALYPNKYLYINTDIMQRQIGYLVNGLVRVFYVDEKGNEITVDFLSEGDYVVHYGATVDNVRSKYYFQCIEPRSEEHTYELQPY